MISRKKTAPDRSSPKNKGKNTPRSPEPVTDAQIDPDLLSSIRAIAPPVRPNPNRADRILGNSDVLVEQWRDELPDSVDVDAFTVNIRLRRLTMLIDERLIRNAAAAGLKLNDALFLLALRRVGPEYSMRPSEIVKMHSVTSGTVTYRIDQLIKQDLAERIPDPSDKRGYLIRLTAHGRVAIDNVIASSAQMASADLEGFFAIPGAHEVLVEMLRFLESRLEQTD